MVDKHPIRNAKLMSVGLVALLAAVTLTVVVGPLAQGPDAFIEEQSRALRQGQREVLAQAADAPRYNINAHLAEDLSAVTGTMTVGFRNRGSRPLRRVGLRLYPEASTVYAGSINVTAASVGGRQANLESGAHPSVAWIALPQPLAPASRATVSLSFRTTIPRHLAGYGILSRTGDVVRLAGWHPMLAAQADDAWRAPPVPPVGDGMVADAALYSVTFNAPSELLVITTGSEVGHREQPGRTEWRFASGPAREFAVAATSKLSRRHLRVGDVLVYFYYRPVAAPIKPGYVLNTARDAITYYERQFGAYPYRELDIIETDVSIGGYEFSGLVMVEAAERLRGNRDTLRYLVAHEVAHQWWYGVVGNDSVGEPWLDEALSSYSAALALEESTGEDLVASWRRQGHGGLDTPVDSPATQFSSWGAYRNAVYLRGALFFDALRSELGDERFFEMLADYYRAHSFGTATADDFRSIAETTAGRELGTVFSPWFGAFEGQR